MPYFVARLMEGRTLAEAIAAGPGGRLAPQHGGPGGPRGRARPRARPRPRRRAPRREAAQRLARRRRQLLCSATSGSPSPVRAATARAALSGRSPTSRPSRPAASRSMRAAISTRSARRSTTRSAGGRRSRAADMGAILSQHLGAAPDAPSVHAAGIAPALDRLVLELLAKDPEARPRTAGEAAERLLALGAAGGPDRPRRTRARAARGRSRPRPRARRGRRGRSPSRARRGSARPALAQHLLREARRQGAAVAAGRCPEDPGAPAYWPWAQALRDLVGAAAPDTPPELRSDPRPRRRRVGSGARSGPRQLRALRRRFDAMSSGPPRRPRSCSCSRTSTGPTGPRCYCWSTSRASWRRRRSSSPSPTATPRLGVRARSATRSPPSRAILRSSRSRLRGLDEHGVAQLLAGLGAVGAADLGPAIHRHTGGNPFFVAEVARVLASEGPRAGAAAVDVLPEGVRALVGRRIAVLAPGDPRAARARCGDRDAVHARPGRTRERARARCDPGRARGGRRRRAHACRRASRDSRRSPTRSCAPRSTRS